MINFNKNKYFPTKLLSIIFILNMLFILQVGSAQAFSFRRFIQRTINVFVNPINMFVPSNAIRETVNNIMDPSGNNDNLSYFERFVRNPTSFNSMNMSFDILDRIGGFNNDNDNNNGAGDDWVKTGRCRMIGEGNVQAGASNYSKAKVEDCKDSCSSKEEIKACLDVDCAINLLSLAKKNLGEARTENNESKIRQLTEVIKGIVNAIKEAESYQYEEEISGLKKKLVDLERQYRLAVSEEERQQIKNQINETQRQIQQTQDRHNQRNNELRQEPIAPSPGKPAPSSQKDPCKNTYTRKIQVGNCGFNDHKCAYKIYTYCFNGKLKERGEVRYENNIHYGGGN